MNTQLSIIPGGDCSQNKHEDIASLERIGPFQKDRLQKQLSTLAGKRVFFRSDYSKEAIPLLSLKSSEDFSSIPYQPKEFSAAPRERNIVAVDSSCALVGETEEGSIYAGRVAVVYSTRSRVLKYCRMGPVIFYLDQYTLQELLGAQLSKRIARLLLSDNSLAERFIRLQLERSAQIEASESCEDSIVLVDGSLRASALEPSGCTVKDLERSTERNFNQLMGISKSTSLKFLSRIASAMQNSRRGAIFIDATDAVRPFLPAVESKVLLAKFSPASNVFRVDYSERNPEEESQVLADLKHNDLFFRGYPETLRLAHHLCVFEASAVASVRSFLTTRYNIVQIPSDDLRATILGKLV